MSEIYKTKTKQEAAMEYSLIRSSVIQFGLGYTNEIHSISAYTYPNQSKDFPAVNQGDTYLSISGDEDVLRRGVNGSMISGIIKMEAISDLVTQIFTGFRLSVYGSFPAVRLLDKLSTY